MKRKISKKAIKALCFGMSVSLATPSINGVVAVASELNEDVLNKNFEDGEVVETIPAKEESSSFTEENTEATSEENIETETNKEASVNKETQESTDNIEDNNNKVEDDLILDDQEIVSKKENEIVSEEKPKQLSLKEDNSTLQFDQSNPISILKTERKGSVSYVTGFADGFDSSQLENGKLIIPAVDKDGVKIVRIAKDAFKNDQNIKSLEFINDNYPLHYGILIEESAFEGCTNLETVDLSFVHEIGRFAFRGNPNLKSITNSKGGKINRINASAFENCTGLESVKLNVIEIGFYAFKGCTSLTETQFKNLSRVSHGAFQGATSLTTISMPEVTFLGENVFEGCSSLESIDLSRVHELRQGVFKDCISLKNIKIDEVKRTDTQIGLMKINAGAFEGCSSLEEIYIPGSSIIELDSNAFIGTENLKNVYINKGNKGNFTFEGKNIYYPSDFLKAPKIVRTGLNKFEIVFETVGKYDDKETRDINSKNQLVIYKIEDIEINSNKYNKEILIEDLSKLGEEEYSTKLHLKMDYKNLGYSQPTWDYTRKNKITGFVNYLDDNGSNLEIKLKDSHLNFDAKQYKDGEKITLPTEVINNEKNNNYKLTGWKNGETVYKLGEEVDFASLKKDNGNVNLYPVWSLKMTELQPGTIVIPATPITPGTIVTPATPIEPAIPQPNLDGNNGGGTVNPTPTPDGNNGGGTVIPGNSSGAVITPTTPVAPTNPTTPDSDSNNAVQGQTDENINNNVVVDNNTNISGDNQANTVVIPNNVQNNTRQQNNNGGAIIATANSLPQPVVQTLAQSVGAINQPIAQVQNQTVAQDNNLLAINDNVEVDKPAFGFDNDNAENNNSVDKPAFGFTEGKTSYLSILLGAIVVFATSIIFMLNKRKKEEQDDEE